MQMIDAIKKMVEDLAKLKGKESHFLEVMPHFQSSRAYMGIHHRSQKKLRRLARQRRY